MKISVAVMGLAVLVAARCPAATPVAAAGTAVDVPGKAAWRGTIQRLGAADLAVRRAAQDELDAMGWRELGFLRQALAVADDGQVKDRLQARVRAIEEELAFNPPPVSVDFKNASPQEVGDALAKLGAPFSGVWVSRSANDPDNSNEPITFQAREQPFWEVFAGLTRQGFGLTQDMGGNLALQRTADRKGWNSVVAGPVVILSSAIVSHRYANLQNDKGSEIGPETLDWNCGFIMDPRVHILRYSPPKFTEMIDDAGQTLFKATDGPPPASMLDTGGRAFWSEHTRLELQVPEKRTARVATTKGVLQFLIQSREEHVEIADPEKKTGQSVDVAGVRVGIGVGIKPSANPGGNVDIRLELSLTRAVPGAPATTSPAAAVTWDFGDPLPPGDAASIAERMARRRQLSATLPATTGAAAAEEPWPYVTARLLDANGRLALSVTNDVPVGRGGGSRLRGSFPGAFGGGNYSAPYTLRISVSTRTKEVTLPFELKDLPLP